jgi:putative ABC transport system ATP-binding protein
MTGLTGQNALVELRTVSKHFGEGITRVDALVDIAIEVSPGEVVGLVGRADRARRRC